MNLAGALDFNAPALQYARKDFPLLQADARVEMALFPSPSTTSSVTTSWSCMMPTFTRSDG